MATLLVTGGAGFIGSNYIRRHLREYPGDQIINVDVLTYAGNLENLISVEKDPRYRFLKIDIVDLEALGQAVHEPVDAIVHFAAESHVDRSIEDPTAFLNTNVIGTQNLIQLGRRWKVSKFVHVSTDEVYGSLGPTGFFTETTPLDPSSPYSASKAASDFMIQAAHRTFGFPAVTTRCSNNYGPYQFPEKLIPLMISNALEDKPLPVYGDGQNVRDWIFVDDHCRAVDLALERGRPGAVYNIGARNERKNLEIVRAILSALGKPESLIRFVADRLGHDRRYAIDSSLAEQELGYRPLTTFEDGIRETIRWYVENQTWWRRIKSGEYQAYYERMYGNR